MKPTIVSENCIADETFFKCYNRRALLRAINAKWLGDSNHIKLIQWAEDCPNHTK